MKIIRIDGMNERLTYHNISALQSRKDALLVNDQSQNGAAGQHTMANAAVTMRMSTARIICSL
jgi:hypothetical protein